MWRRVRPAQRWNRLVNNYWFVPATMVALSIGLSVLLPLVDHILGDSAVVPDWIYGGGPDGARALLTTIAGSMITVAALTFSITIVGLSTASQQFGPRLLRNFLRDRGYKLVLGTFLATFVYCLLVLRTVRSNGAQQFVPYVSLAFGMLLAAAGVGVLVYFIHHAAFSIRAETVVAATGRELRGAIDRLYPRPGDGRGRKREPGRSLPEGFPAGAVEVTAEASGYIQAIDLDRLRKLAHEHDLVLRLEHRVGSFVVEQGKLLEAWPETAELEELGTEMNRCFVLGTQRSLNEDVESAVDHLVEIALRSLSPGINDPETACACVDQLVDGLRLIGDRVIPAALVSYEGVVRLVTYPVTYPGLVDAAFGRIRQYARGSVPVLLRLLEGLAVLTLRAQYESHRLSLGRQARMVWQASQQSVLEQEDLRVIELRYRAVERALEANGAS
jgi:uncharacterized membrane protein